MRPFFVLAAVLMLATLPPAAAQFGWCPGQNPHTYVSGGSVTIESSTAGISAEALGSVVVYDTNTSDCDGDGLPADFDRDWDFGIGGGYFPVNHHSGLVCVNDVFFASVAFVIGVDGNGNGVIAPDVDAADATTGPFIGCGSAPSWGCAHWPTNTDPNVDVEGVEFPEVPDLDDGPSTASHCDFEWLTPSFDGFWVFLQAAWVWEDGGSVFMSDPPTVGTIMTL